MFIWSDVASVSIISISIRTPWGAETVSSGTSLLSSRQNFVSADQATHLLLSWCWTFSLGSQSGHFYVSETLTLLHLHVVADPRAVSLSVTICETELFLTCVLGRDVAHFIRDAQSFYHHHRVHHTEHDERWNNTWLTTITNNGYSVIRVWVTYIKIICGQRWGGTFPRSELVFSFDLPQSDFGDCHESHPRPLGALCMTKLFFLFFYSAHILELDLFCPKQPPPPHTHTKQCF